MRKVAIVLSMAVCAFVAFALPKIAVLTPTLDKSINAEISSSIVDKVQEVLLKSKKYSIVDRSSRDVIWEERNFQLSSGEIDQKEIKSIGQGLGADFVVVIKVKKVGSLYAMSTSVVNVESLEVIGQASAEAKEPIENVLKLASKCGAALADVEYEESGEDGEPVTFVSKKDIEGSSQAQAEVRGLLEDKAFLNKAGQSRIASRIGGMAAVDRYNLFENYKKDTSKAVIAMVVNAAVFLPLGSLFQGDVGGFFGILGIDFIGVGMLVGGGIIMADSYDDAEYTGGALLLTGGFLTFMGAYVYGYVAPYLYNASYNAKLARALNVTASAVPQDIGVRIVAAPGGNKTPKISATLVSFRY
jgi:hypothetical protein